MFRLVYYDEQIVVPEALQTRALYLCHWAKPPGHLRGQAIVPLPLLVVQLVLHVHCMLRDGT